MVVLAASIVSKTGKVLVSRQYVDMSRIRIEALLASFSKLVGLRKQQQHTYIETDDVGYVYQPIESHFLLLVTTKQSNILEDLDTLKTLSELVHEFSLSLDEKGICKAAFEVIDAFDEVISLGYKEDVTVAQVKEYCKMKSNEEKLHQLVMQRKIDDTKEVMKRKANETDKSKVEMNKTVFSSLSSIGSGRLESSGNASSRPSGGGGSVFGNHCFGNASEFGSGFGPDPRFGVSIDIGLLQSSFNDSSRPSGDGSVFGNGSDFGSAFGSGSGFGLNMGSRQVQSSFNDSSRTSGGGSVFGNGSGFDRSFGNAIGPSSMGSGRLQSSFNDSSRPNGGGSVFANCSGFDRSFGNASQFGSTFGSGSVFGPSSMGSGRLQSSFSNMSIPSGGVSGFGNGSPFGMCSMGCSRESNFGELSRSSGFGSGFGNGSGSVFGMISEVDPINTKPKEKSPSDKNQSMEFFKTEGEDIIENVKPTAPTDHFTFTVVEELNVKMGRDGKLNSFNMQGTLSLQVLNQEDGFVKVRVKASRNPKIHFDTYPNINHGMFEAENILGLEKPHHPFPTRQDIGLLRWRMQITEESMVPLKFFCFPKDAGHETIVSIMYEASPMFDLTNVIISIPLPSLRDPPRVSYCVGEWRYDPIVHVLKWYLRYINKINNSGRIYFEVPRIDLSVLFPISVQFAATNTYGGLEVIEMIPLNGRLCCAGETPTFIQRTQLVAMNYQVV